VAIVAILAAIALPLYQDYVARSQVSEGMAAAGAMKTSISEYYMSMAQFPSAGRFDDTVGGRYTASVAHDDAGEITVTMRSAAPVNSRVQGYTFTMAPDVQGDSIVDWTCDTAGE